MSCWHHHHSLHYIADIVIIIIAIIIIAVIIIIASSSSLRHHHRRSAITFSLLESSEAGLQHHRLPRSIHKWGVLGRPRRTLIQALEQGVWTVFELYDAVYIRDFRPLLSIRSSDLLRRKVEGRRLRRWGTCRCSTVQPGRLVFDESCIAL